jgi:DNA ligase (NAD+)
MAYCANPDCPAQRFERLVHFASQGGMDIRGLGPSTLQKMIDATLISDAPDLYVLTEDQLAQLPGFKDKSIQNLLAAIEASKQRSFERVLFALGIRHVGEGVAQLLAAHFHEIDNLLNATQEETAAVPGIGPEIASSIHSYCHDPASRELVSRLRHAGLRMKAEAEAPRSGPLTGKTFLITGTLESMARGAAEKWIHEKGGKVVGSVSRKLDYLIVGAEPGSKLARARELGVKEISEADLISMAGGK